MLCCYRTSHFRLLATFVCKKYIFVVNKYLLKHTDTATDTDTYTYNSLSLHFIMQQYLTIIVAILIAHNSSNNSKNKSLQQQKIKYQIKRMHSRVNYVLFQILHIFIIFILLSECICDTTKLSIVLVFFSPNFKQLAGFCGCMGQEGVLGRLIAACFLGVGLFGMFVNSPFA